MKPLAQLLDGIEISFDGHIGPLKVERDILFVESPNGFAVIRRYNSEPTFGDIQATLIRKGIL